MRFVAGWRWRPRCRVVCLFFLRGIRIRQFEDGALPSTVVLLRLAFQELVDGAEDDVEKEAKRAHESWWSRPCCVEARKRSASKAPTDLSVAWC